MLEVRSQNLGVRRNTNVFVSDFFMWRTEGVLKVYFLIVLSS